MRLHRWAVGGCACRPCCPTCKYLPVCPLFEAPGPAAHLEHPRHVRPAGSLPHLPLHVSIMCVTPHVSQPCVTTCAGRGRRAARPGQAGAAADPGQAERVERGGGAGRLLLFCCACVTLLAGPARSGKA